MSEQQQAQFVFNIEKIYVKDLSVEVPNAPEIFSVREAPQMEVNMSTQSSPAGTNLYHNSITVTVSAKVGDKTMFMVECTQAGIFRIENAPAEQLPPILGIGCPNIVFPYLRETISDAVTRAGFPSLLLNPVNFESHFLQQQQAMQQQQQAGEQATTH